MSESPSCLRLNDVPSHEHNAFCLSIHCLMDTGGYLYPILRSIRHDSTGHSAAPWWDIVPLCAPVHSPCWHPRHFPMDAPYSSLPLLWSTQRPSPFTCSQYDLSYISKLQLFSVALTYNLLSEQHALSVIAETPFKKSGNIFRRIQGAQACCGPQPSTTVYLNGPKWLRRRPRPVDGPKPPGRSSLWLWVQ